ncbi:MAG TPA: SPOR domain-containing protein [Methylomirabilota bacterium]|nr:SPOR domain-containing protein [Methylomirabilota bacterium]
MAPGRRRQGSGSRTGTILVLAGIAGVLTVTFVAGVWTGRHWPLLAGDARPLAAPEPASARRGPADRPQQAEPLPALTFYHELTAPLTAPPPPAARPRAAARPQAERVRSEAAKRDAAGGASPDAVAPPAALPPPATGSGFTVQVGAYNLRSPAEALRATLAAAGHEARVVEGETSGAVRYRVQVGAFATREAAREAAARLGHERSLPAFVTAR